ncbi:hypothetical protein VIBC2010_17734 [Vibrio caribbeanicus ATCC BAA-2122]|uniref:Uncharacterized protein n=1 Tax=Vibrio caribbeanicus ATCC BAA-2122 TaxID=796620 RepID=E3BHA6_9VIBR|nr:hypothetical protein VIBC2010_17734 [Vibrio caribbeanicus ATCC BAA-2122]
MFSSYEKAKRIYDKNVGDISYERVPAMTHRFKGLVIRFFWCVLNPLSVRYRYLN